MTEPVQPIPKRFWWLKRLGLCFVIFVLLLVGLRLWWGHRANARLNTLITEIQATGQPIHFDDMIRPPVPDDQNKAYFLRQALAQWPTVPGLGILIDDTDWSSYPDKHPDPITDNAAYLTQLAPIIELLEQAEAAPDCDWGTPLTSPAINYFFSSYYGDSRRLARLMEDAAHRAADAGDAPTAFHLYRLHGTLAEAVNQNRPLIIGHLVAISITHLPYGDLEETLPGLDLTQHDPTANRVATESLMRHMTDESSLEQSLQDCWIGERWLTHDSVTSLLEGRLAINSHNFNINWPTWLDRSIVIVFRPALVNDGVLCFDYYNMLLEASRQSDSLPDFKKHVNEKEIACLGEPFDTYMNQNGYLHPLGQWLPQYSGVVDAHYRSLAVRRMAAIALAIKLYETDHGQRPDSLEELVPFYLPAVPLDPLATDGSTIRYLPQGALLNAELSPANPFRIKATGPPILYSVGEDGFDHGGVAVVDYDGVIERSSYNKEACDMWFLLDKPAAQYPIERAEELTD